MNRLPAPRPAPREDDRTPRWRERDTGLVTTAGLVTLGFLAALSINVLVLPDTHIISSLYLLPVLVACHRWRPSVVAATAVIATALYVATAHLEQRPLSVWPFGVLALLIGGYLTVRFAKQRQDIARLARREAEDRRHLQTFIGMVAHDLAGAMTNVLVGAAMLDGIRQAEASAEERIAITAIDGGTHQMQRLLDDLRDASAIGAGKFRVQPVMMDLVTVLAETVDQQRARNPLHRITLAAPNHVQGAWDRERLGQLASNLVSNACKYAPGGSEVRVSVDAAPDAVTIGVRDQDIGIAKEYQALIFEPFARLPARDDIPGTGLGLWIAKAITEAHGGHIWVESEQEQGSAFFVSLPRSQAAPDWSPLRRRAADRERAAQPNPAPSLSAAQVSPIPA